MTNRLASATSPYLLQHQDNPVDWWPWCDEAFEQARRRDVPLLISIGYAACHWCHVMAHESFEDPATAEQMNRGFVNIKVDREERPDVDAVYMDAVTALTGHGGWPMTVFATPDGTPFYAGTYFPPTPRHGMPAFRQLLAAISDAWQSRRDELLGQGQRVLDALSRRSAAPAGQRRLDAAALDAAAASLARDLDPVHGGFGGAPKFPPSMCLEFLLRHHARTADPAALRMVTLTCERMARGGIYDQLAGGFARYSVDETWTVPHFEKMLYDNALLLRVYAHLWRATGSPLAERVARETAGWLLAELRTSQGGFASSLDADSEGVEGRFYVWTPEEVGPYAAELFHVTATGTFEHGTSVLQLPRDPDDPPRAAAERARLAALRARRPRPARDEKVVAAWNGLAIAALADAGALLAAPELVAAARTAAQLLLEVHLADGRLRRTSRDGVAGSAPGVLEDYGDVAEGLLTLHQVTGEGRWLQAAEQLLHTAVNRFNDGRGGFYDTADDAERLIRRPQDPTDNATPSGTTALAGALATLAALTGDEAARETAERAVGALAGLAAEHARFAGWACAVGEALLAGPPEIAVVGPPEQRAELERLARLSTLPGAVVVAGRGTESIPPLLSDRAPVGGRPTVYLCRRFACERPRTDPAEVRAALGVATPHAAKM